MEKALGFYRDLLGLKICGTTDEKGDYINQLLAKENIELKTIKLSAEDNATRIELLKFSNSKSNQTKKIELSDPGFTHIALTVNNLDEIYLRLRKAGIQFNCPPKSSLNGKLKITFCRDFEGNYLELTEEIL
ncbi:MAG: VOC family protein [Thaumarchaeota archaeon]|nr:VOC family protein [Nitrososphaerota archaeon]